jgi:hypothetical protein
LNIARETVTKILVENLGMMEVCAKMVPKNLTIEQKLRRKFVCVDLLETLSAEPDFLDTVVTGDESWIFAYDLETKRQSMQWKTNNASCPKKKAHMTKSKIKTMFIVFFDSKGILLQEYVSPGQTVNQHYYITILERL